jgi:hypothetical protein
VSFAGVDYAWCFVRAVSSLLRRPFVVTSLRSTNAGLGECPFWLLEHKARTKRQSTETRFLRGESYGHFPRHYR